MKAFIVCSVILFISLLLWAMWVIYSRISANRIMRDGRNKKNFAYNYLSLRFSRLNTMKNIRLLIKDRSSICGKYVADIGTVFVNRGGVFIIDTVYGSGFVDVEENGTWCRTLNEKKITFEDPFIANSNKVKSMKTFLKNEKVDSVPVTGIVLFTGKRVKFSKRMNGLLTAPELPLFLSDANMDMYSNNSEIRKIVKLIKNKQP